MFQAFDKTAEKIRPVFIINGDQFLTANDDGEFVYRPMTEFTVLEAGADRVVLAPKASTARISFVNTINKDLSAFLSDVFSGAVELHRGDTITCSLQSDREVDFVVTDVEEKAYRLESRDCFGRYVPMTEIDGFFSDVWNDLPAELRNCIMDTERYYVDNDKKVKSVTRKLFLPSASEIFPPDECLGDRGVYVQMEWYKDLHNRVRCFEKGGDTDWYWTGSPCAGSSAGWCAVANAGTANNLGASGTGVAAPVCFRIPRS